MLFQGSFPAIPLALHSIRQRVLAVARQCGVTDDVLHGVELAVSEAATNAIVHGYRGREGSIHVSVDRTGDELHVTVADDGGGLAPRADSPGSGFGLPLMAQVAAAVDVHSAEEGTRVHLRFPCPTEDAGRG